MIGGKGETAPARRRLKLLMLISELGYGGAEGSFLRLSKFLSQHHDVELAVFQKHYAVAGYSHEAAQSALTIHVLDESGSTRGLARWRQRFARLKALKRSIGADVSISFLTGASLLNVLARAGEKTVVSVRGSRKYDMLLSSRQRVLFSLFDRITFARADTIVSVSEGVTREISEHAAPRERSKFRTISGYADVDALTAAAALPVEAGMERIGDYDTIAAIGRLSREKGFHHLLRVFAAVRQRRPSARLVLIGDGPMHAELQALAANLGLSSGSDPERIGATDVLFLGYRRDPVRYLRHAKLFVLTSQAEGFPNVLIEALAAGAAIAAADAPWGAREVLGEAPDPEGRPYPLAARRPAPFGLLLPRIDDPQFHSEWADALEALLAAPAADEQAIAARRARARSLSCEASVGKWLDLLEELTAPSRRNETGSADHPRRGVQETGRLG